MKFINPLILAVLFFVGHVDPCDGATKPFRASVGVNGVWLDGPGAAIPQDFEGAGNLSLSLSPHLSVVGNGAYGFSYSYVRGDIGARVTATDVDNPNFNAFLGIKYRVGSKDEVRPAEWAPNAGFGWKPAPALWPQLVVGADAGYGLQSQRVLAYLAVRYLLGGAQ